MSWYLWVLLLLLCLLLLVWLLLFLLLLPLLLLFTCNLSESGQRPGGNAARFFVVPVIYRFEGLGIQGLRKSNHYQSKLSSNHAKSTRTTAGDQTASEDTTIDMQSKNQYKQVQEWKTKTTLFFEQCAKKLLNITSLTSPNIPKLQHTCKCRVKDRYRAN